MTREQRLEEMLHHAHERGYYTEVMNEVRKLNQTHPKMNFYERWELAYQIAKQEFYESQPTDQLPR
jgi:ribosomal protein S18 acetylase RimI-like enzyme